MPEDVLSNPEEVLAIGDPGDETARRYRYQWTYAAIMCCALLDSTEDVVEVFCEHHEDVLLKHRDGKFSGLQIKTRQTDQPVWKTSDESVRAACARFARLESQFPGVFRAFRFLTNHPIHEADSTMSIRYVVNAVKGAPISELRAPVVKIVKRVAKDSGCEIEVVYSALRKTHFIDELPKLADIEVRLVSTLCLVWERSAECTHPVLVAACRGLTSECCRASSLAHEETLPGYVHGTSGSAREDNTGRIAGKRFDRDKVIALLEAELSASANLEGSPDSLAEPGTGTDDLLIKKLDAGGFSAVSLNSAMDLRDKADYLGIVWTKKFGRERGLQRYGHIRSLVLSDAARTFEEAQDKDHRFGPKMLSQLRSRFRDRREDGSQLYDCTNEHLEGFAYSLTSQCKVQWSTDRPWEKK